MFIKNTKKSGKRDPCAALVVLHEKILQTVIGIHFRLILMPFLKANAGDKDFIFVIIPWADHSSRAKSSVP
jgi:hypothetical protein